MTTTGTHQLNLGREQIGRADDGAGGIAVRRAHSTPDPEEVPQRDPKPNPHPDDVPPPVHAPVEEPTLPEPPIKMVQKAAPHVRASCEGMMEGMMRGHDAAR